MVFLGKIQYSKEEGIDEAKMEALRKAVASGSKLNMPWLDYTLGTDRPSQEGRHRALLAKEMGISQIPVMIITNY